LSGSLASSVASGRPKRENEKNAKTRKRRRVERRSVVFGVFAAQPSALDGKLTLKFSESNEFSVCRAAERRRFDRCLLVVSAERRRFTRRPPSFPPNAFVFRRILPSESILSTGKTLAASSPS